AIQVRSARSIAHEPARSDKIAGLVHHREAIALSKRHDPPIDKKGVGLHKQRAGLDLAQSIKGCFDLAVTARIDDLDLLSKLLSRFNCVPHIRLRDWIARVDEKSHHSRCGYQLAQKPDLLRGKATIH